MSRLVVHDRREGWERCVNCKHRVDPETKMCEDPHLPCFHGGCLTDSQVEALADEAERGYALERLVRRDEVSQEFRERLREFMSENREVLERLED